MLCPCAMSFFQRLCSAPFPPVSCSFPEPCPGPWCCLYNLLEGQSENSWPLGGKYCIISNPSRYSGLHLPCFLQYVQHQHLSVNPLGQATGTQCLLEVHQLASLQRQLVSGDNICPFRSWPCRPLGPKPLAPFSEGYKHTPGSNLLFTFIEHLICCLLLICSWDTY